MALASAPLKTIKQQTPKNHFAQRGVVTNARTQIRKITAAPSTTPIRVPLRTSSNPLINVRRMISATTTLSARRRPDLVCSHNPRSSAMTLRPAQIRASTNSASRPLPATATFHSDVTADRASVTSSASFHLSEQFGSSHWKEGEPCPECTEKLSVGMNPQQQTERRITRPLSVATPARSSVQQLRLASNGARKLADSARADSAESRRPIELRYL